MSFGSLFGVIVPVLNSTLQIFAQCKEFHDDNVVILCLRNVLLHKQKPRPKGTGLLPAVPPSFPDAVGALDMGIRMPLPYNGGHRPCLLVAETFGEQLERDFPERDTPASTIPSSL